MIGRSLQLFFLPLLLTIAPLTNSAELQARGSHRLTFHDVDGNNLSTADGHVTVITVVTRQSERQARAIADQIPDRCLGDPRYRYITLVNFQRKVARPLHGLTQGIIRRRLDAEARQLKPKYDAKHLTREPRKDVYVVADFDGTAVTQLGLAPESNDVAVFVFNGAGKLIAHWIGSPPGESLATAISQAETSS